MGLISCNCPNCGATIELDDTREFGFCSYCGTKVMQDKVVVEHKGAVKVDNSDFVEKYLANARRAYSKEDWDEVEKYYNLVEQNSPNNIEALFFSAYGKTMSSLVSDDYFKRQQNFNVLENSMSVISDYFETSKEDKKKVLYQISDAIEKMYSVNFVFNTSINSPAQAKESYTIKLENLIRTAFKTELEQIKEAHPDLSYLDELIEKNTRSKEVEEHRWGLIIFGVLAVLILILLLCAPH